MGELIEITCNEDTLRQFARYEITFQDLVGSDEDVEVEFVNTGFYHMTLDDFIECLNNASKKEKPFIDFVNEWLSPMETNVGFQVGYKHLFSCNEEFDCEDLRRYVFIDRDQKIACNIMLQMLDDNNVEFLEDLDALRTGKDYTAYIQQIEYMRYNMGRPFYAWLMDEDMEHNLLIYLQEHMMDDLDKASTEFFKGLVKKYCDQNDSRALCIYGDCCYKGRYFEQNYAEAKKAYKEVVKQEENFQIAYFVGYMEYHGLGNDGVPNYDAALKYFVIALAADYPQVKYLIGDMLYEGKGMLRNVSGARAYYEQAYARLKKDYEEGNNAHYFAEASYRMARLLEEQPENALEIPEAYGYYLESALALHYEEENEFVFEQDMILDEVTERIRYLSSMLYPFTNMVSDLILDLSVFEKFVDLYGVFTIEYTQADMDTYRIHCETKEKNRNFVVRCPWMNFAMRTNEIVIYAKETAFLFFEDKKIDVDRVEVKGERVCMFYQDKLVGDIQAQSYIIDTDDLTDRLNHEEEEKILVEIIADAK